MIIFNIVLCQCAGTIKIADAKLLETEDCRDVANTSMIEPLCSTPTASDQIDDSNLGLCFKISVTVSDVITVPVTHCMCIDTSLVL